MRISRTALALALAIVGTSLGLTPVAARAEAGTPVLEAVSTHTAPSTGGTWITLTGHAFTARAPVLFGTEPALRVQLIDATRLRVRVPAHQAGIVHISVGGGHQPTTQLPGFSFQAPSGIASDALVRGRMGAAAVAAPTRLDPGLAGCITDALGKPVDSTLTSADLLSLHSLFCQDRAIVSLGGIEEASNLVELDISRNTISDLTPLGSLDQLEELWIPQNQVRDLSALSTLKHLRILNASSNQISSLAPLSALSRLSDLMVEDNQINSLAGLQGLTALVNLQLSFNNITSLAPLSRLVLLQELHLWSNDVLDLGPLGQLPDLRHLDLAANSVSDLTPLGAMTRLEEVNLEGNQVQSVSPLARSTGMLELNLNANRVTSVQPLSGLTHLRWIFVRANRISDLTPFAKAPAIAVDAQDQVLQLPVGTAGWWPLALRDRRGTAPVVSGATITSGVLRWPGSGASSASFTSSDGTFSGHIQQLVRSSTRERPDDSTGDGWGDLYGIDAGTLRLHPGSNAGLGAATTLDGRWTSTRWIGRIHDVNGDHQSDLLSVDSAGVMWLHLVLGPGHLAAPTKMGSGWAGMSMLTPAGHLAGGSTQYLTARQNGTGALYRYTVTGKGVSQGTKTGLIWPGVRQMAAVGDWNGDGRDDLVGIWGDGRMQLFTTTTRGTLHGGPTIGRGWSKLSRVVSSGDMTGDGRPDLVAQRTDGTLRLYENRAGRWGSTRQIATGWPATMLIG